jgi:hypothetical protein
VLDAMPEQEMRPLVDSAIEYAEELRQSGHYIASDALQRVGTARTIRVRSGKVSTTAGPTPRPRSSWVDSSSSRPRTWTRPARSPRGFRGARRGARSPAGPGAEALA